MFRYGQTDDETSRKKSTSEQKLQKVTLFGKIVLVLGEEVNGIDYSLYDIIDLFLEIPMKGKKESFNVSVAAGIAMYCIMSL